MMKKLFTLLLSAFLLLFTFTACIEDGIDPSPSSQPVFSVDTLNIGVVFTDQATPTSRFTVYNPHGKVMNISNIALRNGNKGFRLNVDGFSGESFSNVEIRPNDSIYVFVEATLHANGAPTLTEITDLLDFTTNGVTRSVVIRAEGQDVERLRGEIITSDTRLSADMPYQIYDSLIVAPGVKLTIPEGTTLHFHDKAFMRVFGSLIVEGSSQKPVTFCGDRTGSVVGDISFDLMASQWEGVHFAPGSRGNSLSHTVIKNTVSGVLADSLSQVKFHNCRLRNSASYSLTGLYADLTLTGCEVAEASISPFAAVGGKIIANHCTFANYYLFTVIGGAGVHLFHIGPENDLGIEAPYMQADFSNCIFYGLGQDFAPGDLTGTDVFVRRCLFKSEGTDDENMIECIWDSDPLYATVRNDYYFDYRLFPESPAIGAADPELTLPESALDAYGTPRYPSPNLGAYQTPAE